MPKKQQKNGFWYFMMDFKKAEEHHGRSFPGGLKEVQNDPECSRRWKTLSNTEKQRYNDLAKKEKGRTVKLTGLGEPIVLIQERARQLQEKEENMKLDIAETIRLAKECGNVPDLTFYLIHVNYFYSKDRPDSSVDYTPAELGIIEFSLAEGVKSFLHQIINVTVEIGYARETMEHGESTHKIPTDYARGQGDYGKIYETFREFFKSTKEQTGKIPPIYTAQKNKAVVTSFLDRITRAADLPDDTFPLYSLECLFGKLMFLCNPEIDRNCNPILLAESELEKDAFAYSSNIECEYHHMIEGTSIHCSLSIVRQWGFTICDYCCSFFGVKMIPNVHCPAVSMTDDLDILATNIACLHIEKKHIPGTVKSMTGVTEEYRLKKAGRTAQEEARRRREAIKNPLVIIDHSLLQPKPLSPPPPVPVENRNKHLRPLRAPKSLKLIVEGSDGDVPALDDVNFPSMGAPRHARSARIVSKLVKGAGRGGIPSQ
ncbi:protein maelstrom homolog [Diachasma alloeum]|uniref:protein maelstrom homolog n=1 Tax=Diachasma alloeum TaxID=454923 RepID=UPI0007381FCF|nr:protein maelstrom homolog [Diachasma alloeum]